MSPARDGRRRTAAGTRESQARKPPSGLRIIHAAVPGRLRCHIEDLYRSPHLCLALEQALSGLPGIERATANELTGNVLVLHAPTIAVRRVMPLVRRAHAVAVESVEHRLPSTRELSRTQTRHLIRGALHRVLRGVGQPEPAWHSITADEAVRILTSRRDGLLPDLAAARLRKHGPNAIARFPPRSELKILIQQLESLPVVLLGAAALLSMAAGAIADALMVLAVIGVNALVGYLTESGAERTVRIADTRSRRVALVRRGGIDAIVDADTIVPGDILLLRQGTVVPADARLLECDRLTVDESTLTGESFPVSKDLAPVDPATPLSERSCMVYRETIVSGGQALAIAAATGGHTEIGRVQQLVDTLESASSPMQSQLESLGRRLTIASVLGCTGVFLIGIVRGAPVLQTLKVAISLAVSAIPEGLPAVATTTLALGLGRLRRNGVVIRQLAALETLGAMQTLCLDKTGTITENRMTVVSGFAGGRRVAQLERTAGRLRERGTGLPPAFRVLLRLGALCTEARPIAEGRGFEGSSTEVALAEASAAAGIDVARVQRDRPIEWMLHRSEGQNLMCTLHGRKAHRTPRRWLVIVKGSPGEVLASCTRQLMGCRRRPLDDQSRRRILDANDSMSSDALRVLGVAYTYVSSVQSRTVPRELTWVGLVGLSDRVREGARQLVRRLHAAGVRTVMITGDQPATAAAIARRIDLQGDGDLVPVSASALETAALPRLRHIAARAHVFARVSPAQKLQIVRALQEAGLIVGMTGDGVNDAPALRAANLGIALGSAATDVARELATIVVLDDRLDRLATAVEEGRAVFQNVQRSIYFLLATNLSEMALIGAAVAAGVREILTPRQLLWINLISDLWPSLALALESPSADLMMRPPRDPRTPPVGNRALATLAQQGGVLAGGALAAYAGAVHRHHAASRAGSVAFLALTAAQLLHAFSVRSASGAAGRNSQLAAAVVASLGLQATAIVFPPLRRLMGLTSLDLVDAGMAAAGALGSTLVVRCGTPTLRDARPARNDA